MAQKDKGLKKVESPKGQSGLIKGPDWPSWAKDNGFEFWDVSEYDNEDDLLQQRLLELPWQNQQLNIVCLE